jgi:hypothetical protein
MAVRDFSEDFYEPEDISHEDYKHQHEMNKRKRRAKRQKDLNNEVGPAPALTPEILARRDEYANDFVRLHAELFPESTGLKPFGTVQVKSIHFSQHIFRYGGRLLKLEPRGYAKTTRLTNEALFAVLAGLQSYVVLVCSNLDKAKEIIDSIKTELMNNDELLELFPGPISCFRHLDNNSQKSRYQTYGGVPTFIKFDTGTLRFPVIEGEPSSGRFIEVRPLSNLKGLNHKIKAGPDVGKVIRPTLYVIDDPQTHAEAKSEKDVRGIIAMIKRDALRGGSHSKRASAIMSITPVAHGDVAFHFRNVERSWDVVEYKMLQKHPEQKERWLTEYAGIYTNYDRSILGDRTRAALAARKFVEDNYEELHKGAEVTWEWAYGWDEEPQTEISPVQHAYNIILDDGWEDFEYECQCNTEYGLYDEGETIHAKPEVIISRTNSFQKRRVAQATTKIVHHIDVNQDFLTYAAIASSDAFHPYLIDYGTHPHQPGIFSKRNLRVSLRAVYPETKDYREAIYLGLKDLLHTLAHRIYLREDNREIFTSVIGVDAKFEEVYTLNSIRDSKLTSLVVPCWGMGIGPDDDLIHEKTYPEGSRIYHNAVEKPVKDRTLDIFNYDTNFFKTEVHKAFNQTPGIRGSLTIFEPEYPEQHKVIADHCNSEIPIKKKGTRTNRTRIVWEEKSHQVDNEFLDNIACCFALLSRFNINIKSSPSTKISKEDKGLDMQAFMKQQRGKKL